MPLISLVGCNAVGKTTAARRWMERYSHLCVVNADIQTVVNGGVAVRELGWKGNAQEKEQLVMEYRQRYQVVLIESSRTTHLNYLLSHEHVIIVTCDWQLYEHHMRERCKAKGKKFRDDYWDERKLRYESGRRYISFFLKTELRQAKHFLIKDQAKDWPAVDEYFGTLYRELHNGLSRG